MSISAHATRRSPFMAAAAVVLLAALCLMAARTPASGSPSRLQLHDDNSAIQPPAPEPSLIAVDVSEGARPVLDRLGIVYQGQPRSGVVRAAASAGQLTALDQAGIAYTTIGKVAIFERRGQPGHAGSAPAAVCPAENWNDTFIPKNAWGYDPNYTECFPTGTVDWVDIHFIITNAYYSGYPPSGQGLTEIAVNLGSNSPSWDYVNVGETFHYCAPSSSALNGQDRPETFGTYDRWIWNVDATMGTNVFYGRPVNQRWDLVAQHYCPSSPQADITYWGIWVYYTPPATATPTSTATPSITPTPTPTPAPVFTGHVYAGVVGDTRTPLAAVELGLYCSSSPGVQGDLIDRTETDRRGAYSLLPDRVCEYYNIMEWDPPGYTSVGATTPGGTVINDSWIQYAYPLTDKVLSDNNFWDLPPATATPTPTASPSVTPTPTPLPTAWPSATATPTAPPTATHTPVATSAATSTATRTPTATTQPTATATRTPTNTQYPVSATPTRTRTPTPTATLPPGCPDLIVNGGFETGDLPPWMLTGPGGISGPGHNSEHAAWLAGEDNAQAELLQQVTIPAGAAPLRLTFWWRADAASEQRADVLSVVVRHEQGTDTLLDLPAVAPLGQWRYVEVDLSRYAGMTVFLTFLARTDASRPTTFWIDDVRLLGCGLPTVTPTATATSSPAPVVITFEEALPNPDAVRYQYCDNPATNRGIEFLDTGRVYDPGVPVNSAWHAFTNRFPGSEFGAANKVRISFTTGQSLVRVRVGLDRAYANPMTAALYAYSDPTPGTGFINYDTVYLGNGPTAITQLLAVSSAAGDIRSVVIEVTGSVPGSSAYEVIDDLEFSAIGQLCITDTSTPDVQISKPAPGQVFQNPLLNLAFVAHDPDTGIAKIGVQYVDAAGGVIGMFYVCGQPGAPACSYDVVPYTASYDFQVSPPAGTTRIRVYAWDFRGNAGFASRNFNLVPVGDFNLWAQGMEITQATQPWVATNFQTRATGAPPTWSYPAVPQAAPLVANRTTSVRVYAGIEGTTGNQQLDSVRAELHCYLDAGYKQPCPGYQWVNPLSVPPKVSSQITVRPGDTLDAKRADSQRSWVFNLPLSWTAAGKINLEAVILPPYGLKECAGCDDAANRLRVSGAPFQTVPPFTSLVHLVTLRRHFGGQTFQPTQAQLDQSVDYLRPRYPVSDLTLHTVADATMDFNDCGSNCPDDRCPRVLDLLQQGFPNRAGKHAVYGISDWGFPCAGVGGGGYSFGNASRPDSFPHEVGHAVGLNHAGNPPGHGSICPPPGGGNCAECNPASWCDTDWPWPHGTLGAYGFDPFLMDVYTPGTTEQDPHDYMSYGGPVQWSSPRNWIRIFNAFTGQNLPYPKKTALAGAFGQAAPPASAPSQEPQPVLQVSGLQVGSDWSLQPAWELILPGGADQSEGTGDFALTLRDAEGAVLFVRRFSVPLGHVDTLDQTRQVAPGSFVQLLPDPGGVAEIELSQADITLATLTRSPNAPNVALVSPGFARLVLPAAQPDLLRIAWTGDDADGDPLRFRVQYRTAGQEDWRTLATDLEDTELVVDPAELPGGSGQVRVLASDGLNTSAAESATFEVPDKAPRPRIILPAAGTTILEEDLLTLEGEASDLQDGPLADGQLTWQSDRDGALGNGRRLEITRLSVGAHNITLTAANSAGLTASTSVGVVVNARPYAPPVAAAGPDRTSADGCSVRLDGTGSTDPNGHRLYYTWWVDAKPAGSTARLLSPEDARPWLTTDRPGDYSINLVVTNGVVASPPALVTVHVTGPGAQTFCSYLPVVAKP